MTDLLKKSYITRASFLASKFGIADFSSLKTGPERTKLINTISDMYCKAADENDELTKDEAASALMLLFWGEIAKMQNKCKAVKELEFSDFAQETAICITNVAMKYRAWQDGSTTAEACIRSALASRGAAAILYESNLDKNKANVNTASLDAPISDDGGNITTRGNMIEDADANSHIENLQVKLMIQNVIDSGDLIGSIILDNIAFGDSTKDIKETRTATDIETGEEYKYSVRNSIFSDRELVKTLGNLNKDYVNYFLHNYSVKEQALQAAVNDITTVNNTKLYKMIHKTLEKQKAVLSN